MYVSCEYYVLSDRSLCDGQITCPVELYRVCVCECDLETSTVRRPSPPETLTQDGMAD